MPANSILPHVSVIIPVLNAETLIEQCLQKITRQTYPKENLEVIVVDNGSTDQTLEIIQSFPVQLEKCEKTGPSAARNKGIACSKGSILLFIDADCYAEPNLIEKHVNAYAEVDKEKNTPDMVGGGILGVNKNFWAVCDDLVSWSLYHPKLPKRFISRLIPSANMSIKRSALDKIGLFNENLRFGEDYELCQRAINQQLKILFYPNAVIHHVNRTTCKEYFQHAVKWAEADYDLYDLGTIKIKQGRMEAFIFFSFFFVAYVLQPLAYGLRVHRYIVLPFYPLIFINRFYIMLIRLKIHRLKRKALINQHG